MIAPGAVVGDIDALFALGVGADEVPSTSMIAWSKNSTGCWPRALAGAVDGIHEIQDVTPAEPATEVAAVGGRDSLCIQGVEISLVVAEPFDMLKLVPPARMFKAMFRTCGLVVGAMVFEQMQVVIDVSDQSAAASKHGAVPPGPPWTRSPSS